MFDRLEEVEKRYEEISQRLYDPQVIADQEEYKSLMREHKQLTPIVEAYRDYKKASENCAQARHDGDSLLEKEFRELAEEEWPSPKRIWSASPRSSRCSFCLTTPTTTKMLSWKSAAAPVGKRRLCFLPPFSGCTACTPSSGAGRRKSFPPTRRSLEVIRKSAS